MGGWVKHILHFWEEGTPPSPGTGWVGVGVGFSWVLGLLWSTDWQGVPRQMRKRAATKPFMHGNHGTVLSSNEDSSVEMDSLLLFRPTL